MLFLSKLLGFDQWAVAQWEPQLAQPTGSCPSLRLIERHALKPDLINDHLQKLVFLQLVLLQGILE